MLRNLTLIAATSLGVAAAAVPLWGQALPGYTDSSTTLAVLPGSTFGLAVLPGGNYVVFDGLDLKELDPASGSVLQTLFSLPNFAFGAFVVAHPAGDFVYLGESTFNEVWEVEIGTGAARLITALPGPPFDLAFDSAGEAFLSWSPGFKTTTISHLDLATGDLADVVTSAEFSGPVAFLSDDSLVYLRPAFGPDSSPLLRFSAAQVQGARSSGVPLDDLTAGTELARLDGGFNLAVDESDDVFVSNFAAPVIVEVDRESGAERPFLQDPVAFLTYLRFVPGPPSARYEPYQPGFSGALVGLRTDFVSFDQAAVITGARPVLTSGPPGPIPAGSFQLELTGAVPSGFGWLLISPFGTRAAEFALGGHLTGSPLWLGVELPFLVLPLFTDSLGEAQIGLFNPGLGGATVGFQVAGGSGLFQPLTSTSMPLAVELQ